jgi:hypothetical protein
MVAIGSKNIQTTLDNASIENLKKQIVAVKRRIEDLGNDIAKINSFTK